MGEYKPRRLGDSFASTTPVRGNAPKPPEQTSDDTTVYQRDFTVGRALGACYTVSLNTGAAQNVLLFRPITVVTAYKLNAGQIFVDTADAGTAEGAFYSYVNEKLTMIRPSQVSVSTGSTGIRKASLAYFTLSPEIRYFWGCVVTAPAGGVSGLYFDSASIAYPLYRKSGSSLPLTAYLSSFTKEYTTIYPFSIDCAYYDSSVVKYL